MPPSSAREHSTGLVFKRISTALSLAALALLLGLPHAAPAAAQSTRIAIEAGGGALLPVSPVDKSAVHARDIRRQGAVEVADVMLVDRYARLSFLLSVGILLDDIELRYHRERWIRGRQKHLCSGLTPATLRSDGRVDDTAVEYDCGALEGPPLDRPARRPAALHRLEAGMRSEIIGTDAFAFWWAAGGGLALTTTTRDAAQVSMRPGLSALAGLGLDLMVPNSQFAIVLEARYRLILIGTGTGFQAEAPRAIATGRRATSAVIDVHHGLQTQLMLRITI